MIIIDDIDKKHCQKHNGPKGWVQWDITFLNILLWEKISKPSVWKNILKNIPYFWYKRTPLNMKYFRALCWVRRSHWAPLFNWERTVPGSKRVAKNFQIFPNLVVSVHWQFAKASTPYGLCFDILYPWNSKEKKKYCQFLARFRYFANLGQKEKKKLLVCQNYIFCNPGTAGKFCKSDARAPIRGGGAELVAQ